MAGSKDMHILRIFFYLFCSQSLPRKIFPIYIAPSGTEMINFSKLSPEIIIFHLNLDSLKIWVDLTVVLTQIFIINQISWVS